MDRRVFRGFRQGYFGVAGLIVGFFKDFFRSGEIFAISLIASSLLVDKKS